MTDSVDQTTWQFYGQRTAFISRVKELHRLREAVRNTIDARQQRAMLVLGPAGIGKSRLISEFTSTIDDHVGEVVVVSVTCSPSNSAPYAIFQRLVRQRFYVGADEAPESARTRIQAGLAGLLRSERLGEEAAHYIGHLVGLPYPNSVHVQRVDGDPVRVEARAVEFLARFLIADASRCPLVITIDNLHLASDESVALLLRLSNRIANAPLLFVAGARGELRNRQRHFVQSISRVGEVLDLPALSDQACRRIVGSLLARAAEIPEVLVKLMVEKAFGNPLTIEQIIELHIERGAIEVSQDAWVIHPEQLNDTRVPGTLRDVVRSKVSRLGPLERSVLEKAAVIGDRFWVGCVDVLRRLDEGHRWDDEDRHWTTTRRADELDRVIEALKRRHIILPRHDASLPNTREFSFKHILEQEVIYEGVDPTQRARLHRLIAQWLEGQAPAYIDLHVAEIARHWERGQLPRKAARYYVRAADRAFSQHINGEAVSLYHRALACLNDDDVNERIDIFHSLGRVHMVLGEPAGALGHFQEMLRLSWLLDDERRGGLAYNKMGQSYRALGEYELAIEHFKAGLVLFRKVEDIVGVAMTADDIGRVHRMRGDLDLAEERIREGLRLRRYLGNHRGVAVSLHHLGNIHTERGDFREAVATMREALEIARRVDDQKTVADILTSTGVICYHRGELTQALTLWGEALEIAKVLGDRPLRGVLLNNSSEIRMELGEIEPARASLEEAVRILEEVGDRRALSDALRNLGSAWLQLGDYGRALSCTERALDEAREVGARGQAGLAERSLGEVRSRTLYDEGPERNARVEAAAAHFRAAIEDLTAVGLDAELGRTLLAHAVFLTEIGHIDAARKDLEDARVLFERLTMRECLERTDRLLDLL